MTRQSRGSIERTTVATGLTYSDLVAAFEREVGGWDPATPAKLVARRATWSEVKGEVERAAGPHGLMILGHADQGALLSLSGPAIRGSLYLVGNPLIAMEILRIDVRASLYVPFRVCLYDDGDPGGASISFDRPSSFLATLERAELADFGKLLDEKIDAVVAAVTRRGAFVPS